MVLPSPRGGGNRQASKLEAANGTTIHTHGLGTFTITLGLLHTFCWVFIVQDTQHSILGAYFLQKFNVLVNVHGRRPYDATAHLAVLYLEFGRNCSRQNLHLFSPFPTLHTPMFSRTFHSWFAPAPLPPTSNIRLSILLKQPVLQLTLNSGGSLPTSTSAVLPNMPLTRCWSWASCAPPPVRRHHLSTWRQNPYQVTGLLAGGSRALNRATVPDRYPVPYIHDATAFLDRAVIFCTIDLVCAYHQLPMAPKDIPNAATTTPFCLFNFLRMPFGLRNDALTFQRFLGQFPKGMPFVYAYIDDIPLQVAPSESTKTTYDVIS